MEASANDFLFEGDGTSAAGRPFDAIAQLADIYLKLGNSAAERVAVHAKLAGSPALIAFVLLQHGENEALFKFAYSL